MKRTIRNLVTFCLILGILTTFIGCGTRENNIGFENETVSTDNAVATPAIRTTPWFEEKEYQFLSSGTFSYTTSVANFETFSIVKTLDADISMTTSEISNNMKEIQATITVIPWIDYEDIYYENTRVHQKHFWSLCYGFVDQYTGQAICRSDWSYHTLDDRNPSECNYTIEYNGQTYDIQVIDNVIEATESKVIREVTVTCPINYEGTAFFVAGYDNTETLPTNPGADSRDFDTMNFGSPGGNNEVYFFNPK